MTRTGSTEAGITDKSLLSALWRSGTSLGSAWFGGIVGNIAASVIWEAGRLGVQSLALSRSELLELSRCHQNHSLLRALRRAECEAMVAVCELYLAEDLQASHHLLADVWSVQALVRGLLNSKIRDIRTLRRRFRKEYRRVDTLAPEMVRPAVAEGTQAEDALVTLGSELLAVGSLDQLRESTTRRYRAELWQPNRRRPLPAQFLARFENEWFHLLRVAFREELKLDKHAESAFNNQVLASLHLKWGLPASFKELESTLARVDAKLDRVKNAVKALRGELHSGLAEVRGDIGRTRGDLAQLRMELALALREWEAHLLAAIAAEGHKTRTVVRGENASTRAHTSRVTDRQTQELKHHLDERLSRVTLWSVEPASLGLPPPMALLERSDDVRALVEAVVGSSSRSALVIGMPGIGKTSVTVAALHDGRVRDHFGSRRFFIRCEQIHDAHTLRATVALQLGLKSSTTDIAAAVSADLDRAPALFVFDNLETTWRAPEQAASVEEFLATIATHPSAAIFASIRGRDIPAKLQWGVRREPRPLSETGAPELFTSIAAEVPLTPALRDALQRMDGHPHAIALLAHQAAIESDPDRLAGRWSEERSAILHRGAADTRETSFQASILLSLRSPMLGQRPGARALLSLLGRLPDGLSRKHFEAWLPATAVSDATALRAIGLIESDLERLRLLTPVRDVVIREMTEGDDLWEVASARYLQLAAEEGGKAGTTRFDEARTDLGGEIGNIEAAILDRVERGDAESCIDAATALARFSRFTGLGTGGALRALARSLSPESQTAALSRALLSVGELALGRSDPDGARNAFEKALPLLRTLDDMPGEANCTRFLGEIEHRRSNYHEAHRKFEEALALFRRLGDVRGEAISTRSLGSLEFDWSHIDSARERFEAALPLYRKEGDLNGEAICLRNLGQIAFDRSNYDEARRHFQEARTLNQKVGSVLGEANCVACLGELALRRSDLEEALEKLEEGLPMYQKVGSVLGQAVCIHNLGEHALMSGDHVKAQERLDAALRLYRSAGSVRGVANCIRSFGYLALRAASPGDARESFEEALVLHRQINDSEGVAACMLGLGELALGEQNPEEARQRLKEALALFANIPQPHSMGLAHAALSECTEGAERQAHVEAARELWTPLGLPHLIEQLEAKFPS